MDGGGRLAGSLTETAPWPGKAVAAAAGSCRHVFHRQSGSQRRRLGASIPESVGQWRRYGRSLDRIANRLSVLPRRAGLVATLLLVIASAGYGAAASGQAGKFIDFVKDIRDGAAVAAGFPIATVSITGEKHLSRDEILAAAGVTTHSSLLFFDVADARARL